MNTTKSGPALTVFTVAAKLFPAIEVEASILGDEVLRASARSLATRGVTRDGCAAVATALHAAATAFMWVTTVVIALRAFGPGFPTGVHPTPWTAFKERALRAIPAVMILGAAQHLARITWLGWLLAWGLAEALHAAHRALCDPKRWQ